MLVCDAQVKVYAGTGEGKSAVGRMTVAVKDINVWKSKNGIWATFIPPHAPSRWERFLCRVFHDEPINPNKLIMITELDNFREED
jgi:hypothetical protein